MFNNPISLYDTEGQRKYLNEQERLRFLGITRSLPVEVRTFCQLIYYTGARIAEIYNLKPVHIDVLNQKIVIETLKQRRRGVFREVPAPYFVLFDLDCFIRQNWKKPTEPIWPFSLRTASRKIKSVMTRASIDGIRSSAKGLRHGFAVHAVTKVPLTTVGKWLGHTDLETTGIYLNIVGAEELELAKKVWELSEDDSKRRVWCNEPANDNYQ